MKIKEFDWINKPKEIKIINSKKLSYKGDSYHAFVYTFESESTLEFKVKTACANGFELFLSPGYGIKFLVNDGIIEKETLLLDQKSYDYYSINTDNIVWKVEKTNDTLFFYFNNVLLTSFTFPSIKASVSLAPITNGLGKVTLEFNTLN